MGVQAVVRSFYYHANYLAVTKPSSTFLKPKQEIHLRNGNATQTSWPFLIKWIKEHNYIVFFKEKTIFFILDKPMGEREGEIHPFSAAVEGCTSR